MEIRSFLVCALLLKQTNLKKMGPIVEKSLGQKELHEKLNWLFLKVLIQSLISPFSHQEHLLGIKSRELTFCCEPVIEKWFWFIGHYTHSLYTRAYINLSRNRILNLFSSNIHDVHNAHINTYILILYIFLYE